MFLKNSKSTLVAAHVSGEALILAPAVSSAGELVDVLKVLELSEDMEGVSLEAGLCTSREGEELTDLAFKIDKKIQLSAPTRQLFPRTLVNAR